MIRMVGRGPRTVDTGEQPRRFRGWTGKERPLPVPGGLSAQAGPARSRGPVYPARRARQLPPVPLLPAPKPPRDCTVVLLIGGLSMVLGGRVNWLAPILPVPEFEE